ncbi:glycosyl transferase family 2 [Virgibacillus phasianinus]|uniref:Glycosyl transferase family 2 n=1 Tax=Virgibacillus phasianinus TaxID=2017483 RepID=A0A220U8T6_9BACI|nr:glycosyl transferase family 2 [Virgibacillus phasianinus]
MKDITAILVHYSDKAILYKALNSLKRINSRLNSIVVLHEQEIPLNVIDECEWFVEIKFITIEGNGPGHLLNDTIYKLTTPYVLFLHDTDYLSQTIQPDSLQIPKGKTVLTTSYHSRNIVIYRPLLVLVPLLKKEKFLSNLQLPFKEALFPAWLGNVASSHQLIKDNFVKQAWKSSSANTSEKEKITQKYQLAETKTKHPSISVLISTYNMKDYVETAVVSCLLQNEQFEQVLIIDDGSTDRSYQQLQQWDNRKQVKVFKKENQGKASALNELLPHVESEFILELDADDWLDPDACSVIKGCLSDLPEDISVLYGNLRKWKQLADDVLFKGIAKGVAVNGTTDLLAYRFPLGPRIYRTSIFKKEGGFPVIEFENGRLYEDVSVLNRLIKNSRFRYHDFTVYNVREHSQSITKNNDAKWKEFIKILKSN